jgi:hypothetical protein
MFKVGDKVINGKGEKGRIICTDAKGEYPVIALMVIDELEWIMEFTQDGKCAPFPAKLAPFSDYDIKPIPKTVWVNIKKSGDGVYYISETFNSFETEQIAAINKGKGGGYHIASFEIPK